MLDERMPFAVSEVTDALLVTIVETIVREYDPEKIILFGSRARGDAVPGSDVDLLVVKDNPDDTSGRATAVTRLFWPRGFGLDVIVYTPEELSHRLALRDPCLRQIISQGKVLYERAGRGTA